MKTLKSKSMKSIIPLVLLFVIIGVVFEVVSVPSLLTSFEEPVNLDDVDFEGDIEGLRRCRSTDGSFLGLSGWL